jgi:hypothetical protein
MAKNKNSKSESLGSSRAASIAKSAIDKAYGKETRIYQKPTKPKKDVNSEDYMGMTQKQKNTKYYSSTSDRITGERAKVLKNLKRAKESGVSNKEARAMTENENPKAKGKDFSKVTYSKVDRDAYDLVMKRAARSGLSPKDAAKAIENAIRVTSAEIKSDRSRTASRAEGIAKRELKKKQNKIVRGY